MNQVAFGWLIRGMHHWGATLMVIVVFLHMLKAFFVGAYKYPREITWLTGGVAAADRDGDGLQRLSPAVESEGVLGDHGRHRISPARCRSSARCCVPILRGSQDIGAVTLARFYGLHIWWMPLDCSG